MKNPQTAVQFGGGFMGSIWLHALSKYANSTILFDPDPTTAKLVQDTSSHFFVSNFLENHSEKSIDTQLADIAVNADMWSISISPSHHPKFIKKGLDENIEYIISEKPVAMDLDELENLADRADNSESTVAVNYIELANPVYQAVIQDVQERNFQPVRGIHWRGKDLTNSEKDRYENGIPHAKDDLVHDISEIDGLYKFGRGEIPSLTVTDVESMELWTEAKTNKQFPENETACDINSKSHIRTHDGAKFVVRGGFNEAERRYFMWIGDDDIAYFANTVSRDHITPVAYRISGEESIKKVEKRAYDGSIESDEEIKSLMEQANAKELTVNIEVKRNYIEKMLESIIDDGVHPATLRDAARIENVIHDIYTVAGQEDALHY